ncbi:MAG: UPF0236 family protein, partial [Actinobacteria bacterium]|nr:UPF0236 family protein [Actinomycetota bacterium]
MNNTISYTICIDTEDLKDIVKIEKKLMEMARKACRKMLVEIMAKKEEKIFKTEKYTKKGKVSRYIYSQFGQVTYYRCKAKGEDGKYRFPLDEALGIKSSSSFTTLVEKRAIKLATLYPYRQAGDILSYEIDCPVDHRAIWRLVQKKGLAARDKRKDEVESLYTDAISPESDNISREIVVIEADGTGISSKEGKGKWMEAKIGIIYTGKKLESKSSKNKRYILENKTVYADIADSDVFGKNISYIAQKKYNLAGAENILFVTDGDRWLKNLQIGYLPGSVHQLDHYHLKKKLKRAYQERLDLLERAFDLISRKKQSRLLQFVKLSAGNGAIPEGLADDLITYI